MNITQLNVDCCFFPVWVRVMFLRRCRVNLSVCLYANASATRERILKSYSNTCTCSILQTIVCGVTESFITVSMEHDIKMHTFQWDRVLVSIKMFCLFCIKPILNKINIFSRPFLFKCLQKKSCWCIQAAMDPRLCALDKWLLIARL